MTATAARPSTNGYPAPHNLEAEESLLGAMLLSSAAVEAGVELCTADDFYKASHGYLFSAIRALHHRGEPVDVVTVVDRLRSYGLLELVGDPAILVSLQANTPSTANAAHYARIVADHARHRRLMATAKELGDAARQGDDERLDRVIQSLEAHGVAGSSTELDVVDLGALLDAVDAAPAPRYLIRGVMAEGDYGMFSAEFKAGKTWAITDLAVSVASGTPWLGIYEVESPGPVLLFAGEGGARKIARRFRAVCESRGLDPTELDVRVCLRAPHLTSQAAMVFVEEEIARRRPRLVLVDPLYLAARGASGSDIYDMGTHLEGIQVICQRHDAALLISHHWNKTGEGRGAKRMSGAGPDAWGRVLISAAVMARHTDDTTKASTTVLELDFQGDEIAESTTRIRRRVWVDDPDDLTSPMHYEVEQVALDDRGGSDPALSKLSPSARRVAAILDASDDWESVTTIGDRLADDGQPLKARTIQTALGALVAEELAVPTGVLGSSGGRWRSARAHSEDSGGENAF